MVEHVDTRLHGDAAEKQAAKRRGFVLSRQAILGAFFVTLLATLLLGLVGYVVFASFDTAPFDEPYHFGLAGWRQILTNNRTWHSITTSFILAIRVPIAIVIAFIIAWLLTRVRIPGARAIEILLWFGFVLPSVPMILGWILLLDTHYGLLNQAAKYLPLVGGPLFSIYKHTGHPLGASVAHHRADHGDPPGAGLPPDRRGDRGGRQHFRGQDGFQRSADISFRCFCPRSSPLSLRDLFAASIYSRSSRSSVRQQIFMSIRPEFTT